MHREAAEQRRPNGGKPAQGSKRQLQIRTLLRCRNSQQHLAEGATLRREVEELRRPNRNQCSAKLHKRLQIRVQLHGQEPKQQLADVPKRRQGGNELGQPKSVRARQGSRMRGENVPEGQHEKKSLVLGFYSDPRALNRIRRTASRRPLTNSIISSLGGGEERAACCISKIAMYPHNMRDLYK